MAEPALFPEAAPRKPKKPRAPRLGSLERIILFPTKEILEWIEAQAAKNERTLPQEIVYRLKQAKKWEDNRAEKGKWKKQEQAS